MAGLKKKKKDKSGSPNVVLVVFLVFFVLATITIGVFLYYAIQEKADARNNAAKAEKTKQEAEKAREYYRFLYNDLRSAAGQTLDKDDLEHLLNKKDSIMKDDYGEFAGQGNKEATRKLMLELKERLKLAASGAYESDLFKEYKAADDKAKDLDAKFVALTAQIKRLDDFSKDHIKKRDAFQQDVTGRIDKENAAILDAVKVKTEEFKAQAKQIADLTEETTKKAEEIVELRKEMTDRVNTLTRKLNAKEAELKEMGGMAGPAGNPGRVGDFTPLIIDMSMGKPLWDTPVGRIVSVNLDTRQVAINIGSSHGIQPEVTFNIFGANASGRAEKQMKGSIEVIKVIDGSTSLCRITSLYDADGIEIPLNLQTRGKLLRESEAPIREGDLLFNLFWGTRVAVAGYVNITGEPSDNPAEQFRQMEDFMYLLRRNGIQVDAYVDLRDGQVRGPGISAKTRYLISGDALRAPGEKPAPPKAVDDPDGDKKDPKEKEMAKDPAPNVDRNDAVNRTSVQMRKEAVERGLLLINAENFATIIGYRKARSANNPEVSRFRPSLPYAGAGVGGVIVVPDNRPKEEEKKEPDKKGDGEKKDAN